MLFVEVLRARNSDTTTCLVQVTTAAHGPESITSEYHSGTFCPREGKVTGIAFEADYVLTVSFSTLYTWGRS